MSLLPSRKLPTFNFLTLGKRGVGKTVFFAGCYAELNNGFLSQKKEQLSWFEGQHSQDKKNLHSILDYVAKTGQYPPATLKITEFNLDLKQRNRQKTTTLCHFRWYDIPGESCDLNDPVFQQLILKSHSCYVFLNSAHLVNQSTYVENLDSLLKQVISIANLQKKRNHDYRFALIFTQLDRLPNKETARLQVEEKIRPFLIALEEKNIKYIRFYSEVPIIQTDNSYKLNPTGTAVSLVWVVSELQRTYRKTLKLFPIQLYLALAEKYGKWPMAIGVSTLVLVSAIGLGIYFQQKPPNLADSPSPERQIAQHQLRLEKNPQDLETLVALSEIHINQGQFNEAISVMKRITQQQPYNLDWQINLAKLYELTQDHTKAEQVYDNILAQDNEHFYALLGKALLRQKDKDIPTSQQLFKQAEEVAPTKDLKDQVRQFILSE